MVEPPEGGPQGDALPEGYLLEGKPLLKARLQEPLKFLGKLAPQVPDPLCVAGTHRRGQGIHSRPVRRLVG